MTVKELKHLCEELDDDLEIMLMDRFEDFYTPTRLSKTTVAQFEYTNPTGKYYWAQVDPEYKSPQEKLDRKEVYWLV